MGSGMFSIITQLLADNNHSNRNSSPVDHLVARSNLWLFEVRSWNANADLSASSEQVDGETSNQSGDSFDFIAL